MVERNDTSSVEPLLIRVLGEWDCPDSDVSKNRGGPQNGWFTMENLKNPIKHGMIWGYHNFWKHPFCITEQGVSSTPPKTNMAIAEKSPCFNRKYIFDNQLDETSCLQRVFTSEWIRVISAVRRQFFFKHMARSDQRRLKSEFFPALKKIKGSCRFCYASEDHLGGGFIFFNVHQNSGKIPILTNIFQLKPPTSHVHMFNRSQGVNLNGTSLCSRRSKCLFQQLDTDF